MSSAEQYLSALSQCSIQLPLAQRSAAIWDAVQAAAAEAGGEIPCGSASQDLLAEVANLVEAPTVVRGEFDPAFLELPK